MSIGIFLDLAIVVVVLLFLYLGAKKGFILTLCSLVAVIVALVGANLVADAAAPMVADAIQPKLEQVITDQLNEVIGQMDFFQMDSLPTTAEDIPLSKVLEVLRENELYKQFLGGIEDTLEEGAAATAASAASRVAAAVAAQLARGIIFVAAFFILLILWSIFSHALDLVSKLPVLDQLNHTLGGILGFVKGLIIAYVAVWVLYHLTGTITPEMAQDSYLFSFLARFDPLGALGSL